MLQKGKLGKSVLSKVTWTRDVWKLSVLNRSLETKGNERVFSWAEMARQLRVLASLPRDLSLDPKHAAHYHQQSLLRGSGIPFWHPWEPAAHGIHIHKLKKGNIDPGMMMSTLNPDTQEAQSDLNEFEASPVYSKFRPVGAIQWCLVYTHTHTNFNQLEANS